MDVREALKTLTGQTAPSGYEKPAVDVARELLKPYVDEVWVDRFGNLVGVRRCGKKDAKTLLLDAHLDEIGLISVGAEDGFVRFRSIGGVDPRMLPDREVTILSDPPLFGVVACLPPHVLGADAQDKSVPAEDLCIDTGLSQEEVERLVPAGTPIVYRGGCFDLGERRMCGKSMDDRACFVSLVRCAELLQGKDLDVDVIFLGSSREEVGGYGAETGAFAVEPDWCVAVDVTHAETPDVRNAEERTCKLGGGPAVGLGPRMARWMTQRFREKAAMLDIPVQVEVMTSATGTNGDDFQISREGVPTAVASLPLRYMHTPVEVLDLDDLEKLAQLLTAFAQDLGKEAEASC